MHLKFYSKILKGRDNLSDIDIDRRTVYIMDLKEILCQNVGAGLVIGPNRVVFL
jgi:hypothetical protein